MFVFNGVLLSLHQLLLCSVYPGVISVIKLIYLLFFSSCKDLVSPPAADQAAELHHWHPAWVHTDVIADAAGDCEYKIGVYQQS